MSYQITFGNKARSYEEVGAIYWVVSSHDRLMQIVDPWTVRFIGKSTDPKRFTDPDKALEFASDRCINFKKSDSTLRRVLNCGSDGFCLIKKELTMSAPMNVNTVEEIFQYCE